MADMKAYRKLAKTIKKASKTAISEASTVYTSCKVIGVENGKTWVEIEGTKTPVELSSAAVSVGDMVTVSMQDNSAVIIGNETKPATDNEKAEEAMKAVEEVREAFYVDENGAHVEGSEYRNDLNSNGMTIVDKLTNSVLARFAKDLVELGNNSARAVISLLGGLGQIELTNNNFGSWLRIRAERLSLYGGARTTIGAIGSTTYIWGLFKTEHYEANITNASSGDYGTVDFELNNSNSREYICPKSIYFESRAFALLGWNLTEKNTSLFPQTLSVNYRNVGSSKYSTKVHVVLLYQEL